ncbi:hypothetical protein TNCV_3909931 [Trichonephila clavipes]|nr:hypothetical protein TNCV_3909931 [Trichonephila clavipes]
MSSSLDSISKLRGPFVNSYRIASDYDGNKKSNPWTKEAERDFCGLPIRRDEGRVVDPPLVLKRVFFVETRREPCPGSRELEESAKERDLVQVLSGKKRKTMNAGGVEELE